MSAVKRSEARKTAILNSAIDCIITIDHEGSITEFNPAAERILAIEEMTSLASNWPKLSSRPQCGRNTSWD